MLMLRLLSVIILGPPALAFIYFSNTAAFKIVLLCLSLLAGFEWCRFFTKEHGLITALFSMTLVFLTIMMHHAHFWQVISLVLLCWFVLSFWVINYPSQRAVWSNPFFCAILGLILISGFWYSLVYLKTHYARSAIFYILFLVWLADSAAYFTGRQFGKRKLAFAISPNKTWEGVFGAAFFCAAYSITFTLIWHQNFNAIISFLLLSLVCFSLSIIGDLAISMFKRQNNLKDTGKLIPGHGGLLDRIDSLLSAVPVFTFGLVVFNYRIF